MPWRVRGSVVSWANRFVGVPPSCLVPPRLAVPLCAASFRLARVMSGFWIRQVGFIVQTRYGLSRNAAGLDNRFSRFRHHMSLLTIQSSRMGSPFGEFPQSRVNRKFCFFFGLHRISLARAFEETFRTVIYDAPKSRRDGCLLGEPTRQRPVLPRSAPSFRPESLVRCPGFRIDRSNYHGA